MSTPYLAPTQGHVVAARQENHDTVTLILALPDNYGTWAPGQFNMLYLFGHGEIPVSISGEAPGERTITHTIKSLGSVSDAITKLRAGDELWLRGPFGSPWPDISRPDDDRDVIFVGGGIGLAPLRPSILSALKSKTQRRIIILVGNRTPRDMIFSDELKEWPKLPRVTVMTTVDRVEPQDAVWDGDVGVVTNLLPYIGIDGGTPSPATRRTIAMTCGPEVMMRFVAADLVRLGVGPQNIYVSGERNMKCAVGMCGRCQWGPHFICRDGPVYRWSDVRTLWTVKEF